MNVVLAVGFNEPDMDRIEEVVEYFVDQYKIEMVMVHSRNSLGNVLITYETYLTFLKKHWDNLNPVGILRYNHCTCDLLDSPNLICPVVDFKFEPERRYGRVHGHYPLNPEEHLRIVLNERFPIPQPHI